jgi:transcriptional regulator GlxA family with amidase domain
VIDERYGEGSLDLRQVAKAVRLSRFHLSRAVRRYTGRTFSEHVRAVRVRAAAELLKDSMLAVKEIADRVGYSGTNALSRNFVAVLGVTPTTYRNRVRHYRRPEATGRDWVS